MLNILCEGVAELCKEKCPFRLTCFALFDGAKLKGQSQNGIIPVSKSPHTASRSTQIEPPLPETCCDLKRWLPDNTSGIASAPPCHLLLCSVWGFQSDSYKYFVEQILYIQARQGCPLEAIEGIEGIPQLNRTIHQELVQYFHWLLCIQIR